MFSSVDYEKFRALRITHVATRFEDLIKDENNDDLTPEQLFLTAVDDALDARRAHRIERLTRQAGFPIAHASIAELDYAEGRGINQVRMRRYAQHDRKRPHQPADHLTHRWRQDLPRLRHRHSRLPARAPRHLHPHG